LPVTTRALAGWPMLYGTAAAASLWIATAILVRWPGGVDVYVPWVWPALLTAAYLAWTQALMWMPYGLPGVRVVIAALWLMVVDVIVLLALNYKAREPVMVAICAPQIPVAYLVAWYAVARARRGDVPDWRGLFARFGQIVDFGSRQRKGFLSPARAQTWFEWRRHGRVLPTMVVIISVVALRLSGRMPVVVERGRAGIEVTGTLRGIAVVLFMFAALFASTWKHLVQSLCIGLTGCEWLIKSSVLLVLIAILAAG